MRQRTVIFIAFFVLLPTFSLASPTADQRAWFEGLSPGQAAAAQRAYTDIQRQERWSEITEVAVTDLVRTPDVKYLNHVGVIPWSTTVAMNEQMKVWWVVEMPRRARVPFDVQIRWVHNGIIIRLQTYAVTAPSPNYRLHDIQVVRRAGPWKVQIVVNEHVLAEKSFRVE